VLLHSLQRLLLLLLLLLLLRTRHTLLRGHGCSTPRA
jgi:hypothetical protein